MKKLFKIVVYVPVSHAQKLRQAIGEAGGGRLGNYSFCSFSSKGIGRFKPESGATPFVGKVGKIEEVEEEKIEFISTKGSLKKVILALKSVHPYETPAYEVTVLERY